MDDFGVKIQCLQSYFFIELFINYFCENFQFPDA